MLALRLLLGGLAILLVIGLLGYSLNRDPRWLRFLRMVFKGGLAMLAIMMLVYLLERLILIV